MPINKTPLPPTPEQQIKALRVQLAQAQEKAKLFEAVRAGVGGRHHLPAH
jgi:hypothetical protein